MSHYVMSDIHGERKRFHDMLKKIDFCKDDRLFIIGDVIDRGPEGIELLREVLTAENIILLLGNHEYMMRDYFSPEASETDILRWNRNGNEPTLSGWEKLSEAEKRELLEQLKLLPSHLEIEVGGKSFYLVHGFVGNNVHDDVWLRPTPESESPIPDCRVIIGHTKVSSIGRTKEEKVAYLADVLFNGEHLHIAHFPGFIDIDCGCGYFDMPMRRLACLRLEDMAEFYV